MNEIHLIRINGSDQPGLTRQISDILAHYRATILDMGQAVIHNNLALGFVIEVEGKHTRTMLFETLSSLTNDLNIRIRYQKINHDDYESWVNQQESPRFIVTILARQINAEHLRDVSEALHENGFNIHDINRLSGRILPSEAKSQTRSCMELTVLGNEDNLDMLRAEFTRIAHNSDVDIAFQRDNAFRRNRRLVVFDMDSTLIQAEVIDELAKEAGVGEQVSEITELAMQGELNFNESFTKRLSLLKGLDESVLEKIAAGLELTEGAERLTKTISALGYKTAIISGGFTYFGEYLQNKLGIDYVFANYLDIKDGKCTGEVVGEIVDGAKKSVIVKQLAKQLDIDLQQIIAIGDGANDLPMLNTAGLGIAFRAKPLVRENAKQAISTLGLDGVLYLLGVRDRDYSELIN